MPKGPDPRTDPAPRSEVPSLLREGAREFNEQRFWHAHEAWEAAWHTLRKAREDDAAAYLKSMIVVAAALENAKRGKEAGFKRQFAEGLHGLKTTSAGAPALGLRDARAFEDALTVLYADACRTLDWARWNASGWTGPRVDIS